MWEEVYSGFQYCQPDLDKACDTAVLKNTAPQTHKLFSNLMDDTLSVLQTRRTNERAVKQVKISLHDILKWVNQRGCLRVTTFDGVG